MHYITISVIVITKAGIDNILYDNDTLVEISSKTMPANSVLSKNEPAVGCFSINYPFCVAI